MQKYNRYFFCDLSFLVMEIHQLEYALEVHRQGSFTAAANALHISQSGVSAQVAKLERELGVVLFDRTSRTTKVTTAGAELLPLMEIAVRDVARIGEAADGLLGLTRGTVRVGTIIGCTIPGYLDGFAEFRTTYPGISVTTVERGSDELLAALLADELDLALLAHREPLPEGLDAFTFIEEAIAVGIPAGHAWEHVRVLDPRELAASDVITLAEGTGIRSALQRTLDDIGVALSPIVEAHSPETVLTLAARGAGIAVLSQSMITKPLIAVSIAGAEKATLSVAMRPGSGPAGQAFMDVLRKHLDETD